MESLPLNGSPHWLVYGEMHAENSCLSNCRMQPTVLLGGWQLRSCATHMLMTGKGGTGLLFAVANDENASSKIATLMQAVQVTHHRQEPGTS